MNEFDLRVPGFTVDALGNITATFANAAGAGSGGGTATGDYAVTQTKVVILELQVIQLL